MSLADLQNDEVAFRKFRLISEDVQGKNLLTNFHGMDMTTDKLRSLVKKWQVSSTGRVRSAFTIATEKGWDTESSGVMNRLAIEYILTLIFLAGFFFG